MSQFKFIYLTYLLLLPLRDHAWMQILDAFSFLLQGKEKGTKLGSLKCVQLHRHVSSIHTPKSLQCHFQYFFGKIPFCSEFGHFLFLRLFSPYQLSLTSIYKSINNVYSNSISQPTPLNENSNSKITIVAQLKIFYLQLWWYTIIKCAYLCQQWKSNSKIENQKIYHINRISSKQVNCKKLSFLRLK